jgi:hypothetical protein
LSTRPPLASASDFDSIGRGKGGGASSAARSSQNRIKGGIAVALLFVAGGLIAWHFGAIDTTSAPAPPSAEQLKERDDRQRELDTQIRDGRLAPVGDS